MKKLKKIWFEISIILAVIWDLKWYILFGLFILFTLYCLLITINELLNATVGNPEKMGEWFGNFIKGFNEAKVGN